MRTPFTSPEYVDYGDVVNELARLIDKLHRFHARRGLEWPPQFLVRQIAQDLTNMDTIYVDAERPPHIHGYGLRLVENGLKLQTTTNHNDDTASPFRSAVSAASISSKLTT
jgi:hypothetical protein